ncbi:MAG: phenylalanine--tRNA ligase subunit beta, partial [Clostridia bacterium]
YGMFCSGEELGIDDSYLEGASINGILIIKGQANVGMPISEFLMLNDVAFDVNITANRPDCMSVYGIAKEISAILKTPIKEQNLNYNVVSNKEIKDFVQVEVKNWDICPRYMAAVIDNVKIEQSPLWLKARLRAVGIKSINNIVDITNYVLIEYGQPMHAFDQANVAGKKLVIRNAEKDEKLKVLNNQEYSLTKDMLVIADGQKASVIAGVIGGVLSSVSQTTKTAIFEAAAFERKSIRITGRKIGVRTDSSARFEKGVDFASPERGLKKALALVSFLNAGEIVEGIIDAKKEEIKNRNIKVSLSRVLKILGVEIPQESILEILNNLGIESKIDGDIISCIVPPERFDIENDADIAEEVIRLYGYDVYDNCESVVLSKAKYSIGGDKTIMSLNKEVELILTSLGYNQALNYSMCPVDMPKLINCQENEKISKIITIVNPISEDLGALRTSMAHGLLTNVGFNLKRGNKEVMLFEHGRIYLPQELPLTQLPNEQNCLAVITSKTGEDFFSLKGTIENILSKFEISYKIQRSSLSILHPGISAELVDNENGETFAFFGKVHPIVLKNYDIKESVFYAEINLDYLHSKKRKKHVVRPISKFPIIERDLAVVVDEEIVVEDLLTSIKKSCGSNFLDATLFDIYRNESLGDGKKSLAFKIKLSNLEKTLTEDETNSCINKVLKDLKYKFAAVLR